MNTDDYVWIWPETLDGFETQVLKRSEAQKKTTNYLKVVFKLLKFVVKKSVS